MLTHNFQGVFLITIVSSILSLANTQVTSSTASISVSPTDINLLATYSFFLQIGTSAPQIPAGSYIKITYPSDYSLSNGAVSCQSQTGIDTGITCTCTSNIIMVANGFSTAKSPPLIKFSFSNIKNPSTVAQTGSFQFQIYDATNTLIEINSNTLTFTPSPGQLTSCTLNSSTQVAGVQGVLTVSFTPTDQIPAGGKIIVSLPKWNAAATSNIRSLVWDLSSYSCSAVSSNLNSGLSCTFSSSPDTVTIVNAFTSATTGSVSFTFHSIINPPSTMPLSGFTIQTESSSGMLIDQCTSPTLTVSQPNVISNFFLYCENTMEVNQIDSCDINFQATNPVPAGAQISVTFPSQVDISSVTSVVGISTNTLNQGITITRAGQTISFSNAITRYVGANSTFVFQFTSIKHPPTTAPTSSFVIQTSISGYEIDAVTSGATYSADPGPITNLSFYSVNPQVLSTSAFTVSFIPQDPLSQTSYVTILFPPDMSIANASSTTSCVQAQGSYTNPIPKCGVVNNLLTVTGLFSQAYPGQSAISVTVNSVTTPAITKPTFPFTISTIEGSNSAIVDQSTTATFSATPGQLSPPTVTIVPDSMVVGNVNRYVFSLSNTHAIPLGGKLSVILPSDITMPDPTLSEDSCASLSSSVSVNIECSITGSQILVYNIFQTSSIPANTVISFSVQGVKNPLSLKPTSSFKISTMTNDGYIIDEITTGKTLTLTTPADFLNVQITPASYADGASTSYDFKVTIRDQHLNTDVMTITFPSSITFLANPACTALQVVQSPITCTKTGQKIFFTLNSNQTIIVANQLIEFSVSAIENPQIVTTTDSFIVYTSTFDSFMREFTNTSLTITTVPATIINASVTPSTNLVSATASYTFTFTPINPIPTDGEILIKVPSELTVVSLNCHSNTGISASITCAQGSTTQDIVVFNGGPYSSTSISFTINSIQNMQTPVNSSSFEITTATSNGTLIDQVTSGLIITPKCSTNCYDCVLPNKSACLSCFFPNYYVPSMMTCVSSCPSGTYKASSDSCPVCSSPCLACQTSATNCSACNTSSMQPILFQGKCLSACPNGYYEDQNSICQLCTSPCLTCSVSSTSCLSCQSPYLLYGTSCVTSCPSEITIQIGNNCQPCMTNCQTCSVIVSNCTSCPSGYFFDQNNCYYGCSAGSYYAGSSCATCDSPCRACNGSAARCTSCNNGTFLYNQQCSSSCPYGYFMDFTSNLCSACASPCLSCISLTICATCNSTLPLYYRGTCVSSCPSTASTIVDGRCMNCNAENCDYCYDGTNTCALCAASYYMDGSTCVTQCVGGYSNTDYQNRLCITSSSSLSAYLRGLPFPFIITTVFLIAFVIMSWVFAKPTSIFGNCAALTGAMEAIVWIAAAAIIGNSYTNGEISDQKDLAAFVFAIILLLVVDTVFTVQFIKSIRKDKEYQTWKNQNRYHKVGNALIIFFSIVLNFKIARLLFSKLLARNAFSAKHGEVKKIFLWFNYQAGIVFILAEIPALVGAIVAINNYHSVEEVLRVSIEVIVVTLLAILFSILDGKRGSLDSSSSNQLLQPSKYGQVSHDESASNSILDNSNIAAQVRTGASQQNNGNDAEKGAQDNNDPPATVRKTVIKRGVGGESSFGIDKAADLGNQGTVRNVQSGINTEKTSLVNTSAVINSEEPSQINISHNVSNVNESEIIDPIEERGREEEEDSLPWGSTKKSNGPLVKQKGLASPNVKSLTDRAKTDRKALSYSQGFSGQKSTLGSSGSKTQLKTSRDSSSPEKSLLSKSADKFAKGARTSASSLGGKNTQTKERSPIKAEKSPGKGDKASPVRSSSNIKDRKSGAKPGVSSSSTSNLSKTMQNDKTLTSQASTPTNSVRNASNTGRVKSNQSQSPNRTSLALKDGKSPKLPTKSSDFNNTSSSLAVKQREQSSPQKRSGSVSPQGLKNTSSPKKSGASQPSNSASNNSAINNRNRSRTQSPGLILSASIHRSLDPTTPKLSKVSRNETKERDPPKINSSFLEDAIMKPEDTQQSVRSVLGGAVNDTQSQNIPTTKSKYETTPFATEHDFSYVESKANINLQADSDISPIRNQRTQGQEPPRGNTQNSPFKIAKKLYDDSETIQSVVSHDNRLINEDTPNNYNIANQRFDDDDDFEAKSLKDIHLAQLRMQSHLSENSDFPSSTSHAGSKFSTTKKEIDFPKSLQKSDSLNRERSPHNLANVNKKYIGKSPSILGAEDNDGERLFHKPPISSGKKQMSVGDGQNIRYHTPTPGGAQFENRQRAFQQQLMQPTADEEPVASRRKSRSKSRDPQRMTYQRDPGNFKPYEEELSLPKLQVRSKSPAPTSKPDMQKLQDLEQIYLKRLNVVSQKSGRINRSKETEGLKSNKDRKEKSESDTNDFESFRMYVNNMQNNSNA